MNLSINLLRSWFPVLSRYLGILGVIYEVVILRVVYHLPPDPTSVMVFAGMMGLAEVQQAIVSRSESTSRSEPKVEVEHPHQEHLDFGKTK